MIAALSRLRCRLTGHRWRFRVEFFQLDGPNVRYEVCGRRACDGREYAWRRIEVTYTATRRG